MRAARGEKEEMWTKMLPRERSSWATARKTLAWPNSLLVKKRILGEGAAISHYSADKRICTVRNRKSDLLKAWNCLEGAQYRLLVVPDSIASDIGEYVRNEVRSLRSKGRLAIQKYEMENVIAEALINGAKGM